MTNTFILPDGNDLLKLCFDYIDAIVDSTQPGSLFHEPGESLLKDLLTFKHGKISFVQDGITEETRIYVKKR